MQNKIDLFKKKAVENKLDVSKFVKWLTKGLNEEANISELSDEEMIVMNIKHEEDYSCSDFDESYTIDFFGYYAPLFLNNKKTNTLYFQ